MTPTTCPTCGGEGHDEVLGYNDQGEKLVHVCPTCHGTGITDSSETTGKAGESEVANRCYCSGIVVFEDCPIHGTGKVESEVNENPDSVDISAGDVNKPKHHFADDECDKEYYRKHPTGRGSSPESPQTVAVTAGRGNGTDESRPGTIAQPAEQGFEQTIQQILLQKYSLLDPSERRWQNADEGLAAILAAHNAALANEMAAYQKSLKADYDEDIREAVIEELHQLHTDPHLAGMDWRKAIDGRIKQLGGKQ